MKKLGIFVTMLVALALPVSAQMILLTATGTSIAAATETAVTSTSNEPQAQPQKNYGCKDVSTPTVALNAVTPVDIAAYLPNNCQGFEFRVTNGEVVVSHGDMIATGASRVGRLIASGGTFIWRDIGGPFVGKVMANIGTASITFDLAW